MSDTPNHEVIREPAVNDSGQAGDPIEEKGIVSEVVVPLVSAGVGGAVSAAVSNALSNRKPKK